jgi:putative zinc finger/helix-turn-helix YgiT family protein
MNSTGRNGVTKAELICPACSSANVREHWKNDTFEYGTGTESAVLVANVPHCVCLNCDLEYLDERAETIRHAAVCHHLGLLSPEEILAVRERYGMTQQEFANTTNIGRASLARWESGALFQNASNDSFIYLLGFTENMDKLIARRKRRDQVTSQGTSSSPRRFLCISESEISVVREQASSFQLFYRQ